ncbi:hypothetical protein [Actinoplanes sp. NPDC049118]|uniref:hypothetical protein n=1 Tax=Actinoplanes sp. NPDC049118 TaxID=3155769 RepID=UPI0033EA3CDA
MDRLSASSVTVFRLATQPLMVSHPEVMETADLKLARDDDVAAASWIKPRLIGTFGAVTRHVPEGYAAYVRVCHPVEDAAGQQVTWSTVAAATGRQAHPTMQWHALVGSADHFNMAGSLWSGNNPDRGELAPPTLATLCENLAQHTSTPGSCYFCLWDGYGWLPDTAPAQLHHGDRDYILLAGPLHAALQLGDHPRSDWFIPQSPNLFWPADRAWCVATEIDFDSTLIGGTAELARQLLNDPALDAWPVDPDDSLAADADLLNPVP